RSVRRTGGTNPERGRAVGAGAKDLSVHRSCRRPLTPKLPPVARTAPPRRVRGLRVRRHLLRMSVPILPVHGEILRSRPYSPPALRIWLESLQSTHRPPAPARR